jgi:hypothetical protein
VKWRETVSMGRNSKICTCKTSNALNDVCFTRQSIAGSSQHCAQCVLPLCSASAVMIEAVAVMNNRRPKS